MVLHLLMLTVWVELDTMQSDDWLLAVWKNQATNQAS